MLYSFGITGETVFLPRYFLKRIFGVLLLLSLSLGVFPQSDLCGKVHDENDSPLPGAHITLAGMEISSITNEKGEFCFRNLAPGAYQLHISYLGYMCMHHCDAEIGDSDLFLSFQLFPEKVKLPEVEVSGQSLRNSNNPAMMPKVSAQQGLIRQNLHGSLMQYLESLRGVRAIEIGKAV